MKIWTLDDGIPGHWSMTAGLVRLFRASREVEETRVKVNWHWGGARQVFQRMERAGIRTPTSLFKMMVTLDPLPPVRPDLIVSRGGITLLANAWLAREAGCANVFIGTVRKLPPQLFSAIILYQDEGRPAPYVPMPLFPTRIDQAALPEAVDSFAWSAGKPEGRIAAMFLGGDGSGYHYNRDHWLALAHGMRRLHEESGVRWCVTSSRRTPPEAEELLGGGLSAGALAETCWWHGGDRRPCLDAFLGVAEQAFCTEDSMSMLEESIASGRPVVALGIHGAKPIAFFNDYLGQRVRAGRLQRVEMGNFAGNLTYPVMPDAGEWSLVGPDAMAASAARLLETLKL